MNRIGDIGLGLGICLIYLEYKTLDFSIIFPLINLFKDDYIFFFNNYTNISTLIVIFIMIGAIGKSAQLGLHTWLPDAMAGPTPVSALIHAATMVTAGVFILIRISPILETTYNGLLFISLIGVLTAFFSATIGLFQNDCKKIIAYSTCSQLGYMVFICGLSNYSLSLFHLTNHAFFKALLFLSAGSIIHAMSDEQDVRRFGGLLKILPFSYIMLLIGSLSLMGIPFLTGFYSKDVIIEIAFCSYLLNNSFIY
jgi:NADH-ubiquinone oxidoreductase chain 5